MPDGEEFKIASAFVEVHLRDETDGEAVKIRTKIEDDKPIDLKTWLRDPENVELIRAKIEEGRPVKLPVDADTKQAQKALKDLTDSVDKSTASSNSNMKGMFASAAAGWTALGSLVAGPLVAGGLAVVAGGFAAIAVAAEKSSPQVQQAFATMKTEGVDLLKNGFSSLTPVIVSSMGTVTNGIRQMGPSIQAISTALGPFLTTLTGSLVKAAQTTLPLFTQALGSAQPVAKALGAGIVDLSTGLGQFLAHLDFSQASTGLQALLSDVGRLLPVVAGLVNAVMPFANALLTSVIPAVTHLAGDLTGDLAPALHLIGATVSALAPLLDFMAGPTASVLVGVAAFKTLQGATNTLLPIFNTLSTGASNFASKALGMVGASNSSVGSFTLLTNAAKQQAVAAAESALTTARQTAMQQQANLATVEAAVNNGTLTLTEEELAAARAVATEATAAEAEASTALAAATRASSFAFGPVGIALGALAGVVALFAGNTDKATPSTENFTQQLNQLAVATPAAQQGIIASDPKLADYINKMTAAGVSVNTLTQALNGNGSAQQQVLSKIQGTIDAFGKQSVTVEGTTSNVTKAIKDWASADPKFDSTLDPQVQKAVKQFRDLQSTLDGVKGSFAESAAAQQAAASASAQAVGITAAQQNAAVDIAHKYGLSVDAVVTAFEHMPKAGEDGAQGVMEISAAFADGEVKLLNAEQSVTDYFKNLRKSADQANQGLASAQHSYEQSVTAVSDAERSAAQSAKAVTTAREGVATATRAVADAVHSYGNAQHSVEQAQQGVIDAENGVITAENNLAKAQDAERQAQVNLTAARKAAGDQLRSLHLQLNDQLAAEQRAQMKLFDQTRTSAAAGVTKDNAAAILAQPLTAQNEALQQSALDLIDAENSLADTMNTGKNLREQVAAADKAGVEGSQQVISAQQALKSAQEQVVSSQQALVKSHQAVEQAVYSLEQANYALGKAQQAIVDSQAGVVKANDAVKDAVYNEKKARDAVKDAIFNEQQALFALKQAQDTARQANDLNTQSLDQSTQAGRNNYAQLQTLFNAYPAWIQGTDRYNQMVNDTANKFNMSRQAAFDFLQQQGQIPKDFQFTTTGVAQLDTSSLDPFVGGYFNGGFRAKNGRIGYDSGGLIDGPGGPRDDIIPIMASAKEFMQPADAVDHYGVGFMEAVRQKKLPKYANGGLVVQSNVVGDILGGSYISTVAMATELGLPHPPQMPQYTPPAAGGAGGAGAFIPGGQHLALIDAALAADGVPQSQWPRWEAGMNVLIQRESSWNANAVNNWDSNARAGHPSGGLTQTIGPTFESYRNRGLPDDMFDPVANIAASINYIISDYDDISRVQQANPNLPPKGYALGDIVGTDGASLLGTMARTPSIVPADSPRLLGDNPKVPESYIPHLPKDPRAQQILSETNAAMGRGNGSVTNHINIRTVETDPDVLAAKVSSRLAWAMRGAS
ncbi:hypothetical protein ATK30_6859 [Amycolatopsis echigonensis]|uniref:Transglycosylase-like protein with SLT domain n=1 Tax=Amycolatopsis echigonensis TaxID=2576905 RepID=A0A2N3WPW4_9PSEU|nr:hypothetical protein [Amycolatopsis niigatensis]PKV95926.1 hypothetical protein ATK30_6859 [Amycolatopsis niigatensis]